MGPTTQRRPASSALAHLASFGVVLLRRLLASEASSEEGADIDDFLATSDGLSLTKYFLRIKNSNLRRRIVDLVEQIAARHN